MRATTPSATPVIVEGAATQVNQRVWIIAALLTVYIIWGTTYLGIRFALESFPPYLLMGIRFTLAGSGLMLFLRLRNTPWYGQRSAGRAIGIVRSRCDSCCHLTRVGDAVQHDMGRQTDAP